MLRIKTGGRLDIDGRTATSTRPIIVRRNTKKDARYAASVVASSAGTTSVTLPDAITGLTVIDTVVYFNPLTQQWTAPELPRFSICLTRSTLIGLPDYLASIVEVHTRCESSTIDAGVDSGRRSEQYTLDLSDCHAGRIRGLRVRRLRPTPAGSDMLVDVRRSLRPPTASAPALADSTLEYTPLSSPAPSPPPMRDQYSILTQLMRETNDTLSEIQAARDAHPDVFVNTPRLQIFSNLEEMFAFFAAATSMDAVNDKDAPDPVRRARNALKDHVSRLVLLASLRTSPTCKSTETGFLYADEADLATWLRTKRPQLVCRLGAHQLTDVVLEATAELAVIEVVHSRRPKAEPVADGAAACAICCEFPPSVHICARCTDGTVCEGCLDRLVLETAEPCCPFCRGALTRPTAA